MEVSKFIRDNNLWDMCTMVPVDWEAVLKDPDAIADCQRIDISEADIQDIIDEEYNTDLTANDIYEADLYDYAQWDWANFDDDLFADIVSQYLDITADKYLVLGSGMGWRKLSGYKECDNIDEVFHRSYDNSVYLQTSDFDRKVLTYKESSHDAPMGASMTVIALNKEEYYVLTNDGYDDPNPDMVDKLLTQGHLDPEDFERYFESDDEDPEDEYGEW